MLSPIIHCDVILCSQCPPEIDPPWNINILQSAKLSDFGLANLVKHCKTAVAGAIIYSAPETFPPTNPYDPLAPKTNHKD